MAKERRVEAKRDLSVRMVFSECALPPVNDALVLGKRTPVGITGVVRALQAMSPNQYKLIPVEHPTVEAVLVREADLRKVPEELFVQLILEQAGPLMDETDALNVKIAIEVTVDAKVEGV